MEAVILVCRSNFSIFEAHKKTVVSKNRPTSMQRKQSPNTPRKMHPELEHLSQLLDEASDLLLAHGVMRWADWLSKDARLIRASDFFGIEHLLLAFGGMGSLNDVVLSSSGDSSSQPRMLAEENERLSELLKSIYSAAQKLAREESAWISRCRDDGIR